MKSERIRDRFMPWAGLALGTLGTGITHQLGSNSAFQDCTVGSPGIVIVAVVIGLGLVTAGALGSWSVYGSKSEAPARRLVAVVSLMTCGIFAVAIILPFIAAMVIPRCWA